MNTLQQRALARVALSEPTVQSFYDGSRSGTAEQCLRSLCESHERLRAEVQGAEILLAEEPGKAAVRQLLTAAKEAVASLRGLNDHEKVCRELVSAKVGDTDLAVILSNVLRRLDNAAEAVGNSLAPKEVGKGGFETWLEETFCGRDVDLKMEAVPHAHILNYEQAIDLATFVWACMENKPPPWWCRFAGMEKEAKKAAVALALTDTGSAEFKAAFPPRSAGEAHDPKGVVPGWRVVEKIREVLLQRV